MKFRFLVPLILLLAAVTASARTNVRITTPLGAIVLELYDDTRPITAGNFLRNIREGVYTDTFAQRLVPGFVIQAGSFRLNSEARIVYAENFDPIVNEYNASPRYSNSYGTIAMSKRGGDPDSAQSGWFINLGDNVSGSANDLDNQNGGFTVFGRVISGFSVLESLNTLFSDANTSQLVVNDESWRFFPDPPDSATDEEIAFANSFREMPLRTLAFNTNDLLYTTIEILPAAVVAPTLSLKTSKKIETRRPAVTVRGKADGDIARVEWRLGKKGKFRKGKGAAKWRVRATRLPVGSSVLYIRGVGTDEKPGRAQRVKVIRSTP